MKALGARAHRLEQRLIQPDYLQHPRSVMRLVVSGCGLPDRIGPHAWCRRRLSQDGRLMELVYLDGYHEFLPEDEIDQFMNSFPITLYNPNGSSG